MTKGTGRVALITGVSSGIGRATALHLTEQGWTVFGTVRDREAAGLSGTTRILEMDVDDDASVDLAVKEVLAATGGRLDALVCNAGRSTTGAFESLQIDDIRSLFETNLFGAMRVTRAALPALRRSGGGRIVLLSSILAPVAMPGHTAYTATKTAMEGWAASLAHEVAPFGIGVTCLRPGPYRTRILERGRVIPSDDGTYRGVDAFLRAFEQRNIRRGRDPHEVAVAVLRAIEARTAPLYRAVGSEARRVTRLTHYLPQRAMTAVIRRATSRPRTTTTTTTKGSVR